MSKPAERFLKQKETIRRQLQLAIAAYQRLAPLDLDDLTRENAAAMYAQYAEIEATFEGVGGALDRIRQALMEAGEAFTAQLELVGFAGERSRVVTESVEDSDEDAYDPHSDLKDEDDL